MKVNGKEVRFTFDGQYVEVYDQETNELIYEDEWCEEDFNMWAKMAAESNTPLCNYLALVIEQNIEAIEEME